MHVVPPQTSNMYHSQNVRLTECSMQWYCTKEGFSMAGFWYQNIQNKININKGTFLKVILFIPIPFSLPYSTNHTLLKLHYNRDNTIELGHWAWYPLSLHNAPVRLTVWLEYISTDFLDVTLDLQSAWYFPFRKPATHHFMSIIVLIIQLRSRKRCLLIEKRLSEH